MSLTLAELTVLGLVAERGRHGYDVERVIRERGVREWVDVGFSSIYYLLTKLEARGLVREQGARAGAKSRRVFCASDEGRRVAAESVLSLIAEWQPVSHPFTVALANTSLLSGEDVDTALNRRLVCVEKRIAAVRGVAQDPMHLSGPMREVLSLSLCLLEAERSWIGSRVQRP